MLQRLIAKTSEVLMQVQRKVVMTCPRLITEVGDAWLRGVFYASVSGGMNVGAACVLDCAADDTLRYFRFLLPFLPLYTRNTDSLT